MKVRSNIKAGQPSITINADTTVTVNPTNNITVSGNTLTAAAK
jgi:protein involved in polysaccharide export with SLBB domain